MTFSETVKSTLNDIIFEMSRNPSDFVNHPDKDFSRHRKMGFCQTISFLLSLESGNTNHELLKFFHFDTDTPTCSAFYQQRSKLKPETFHYLLKKFNSHFPLQKYKGKYYLIACDGSEFNIPRNPDDALSFNPPNKTALRGFNMIHTISLYDVLSKRYLDLEIQPSREKNEFRALCNLMDRYSYGGSPIIIADRGFASYNVFAHAIEDGIDFAIRAKDITVQRLLRLASLPDFLDTTVEIFLTRTQSKKKCLHPELADQYRYICRNISFDYISSEQTEYKMTLRIVRFEVADGIFENIITSLAQDVFPMDEIQELYHLRWMIELSFRDLKHTIGTLNFHSKKRKYIEQELWCRLILYNFCSIIIVHTSVKTDGKKYIYQVNFSMAMKICIAFLQSEDSPPDTEGLISRYILPIRPERNYARQHRIQHPASFAYRFV